VVTVGKSQAHQDGWSAEQLFAAFRALGMTEGASNMVFTEYDGDGCPSAENWLAGSSRAALRCVSCLRRSCVN
jgi:hypothetical protein